ncbi:MAG TPA: HlyD family efflux transporter periplasmic adaptor subunit [Bryobacteraceae bacterium]|nr:HlyD family efflux transporter periplasmic adaptor subunit [Bryobacteraceae bacterium]
MSDAANPSPAPAPQPEQRKRKGPPKPLIILIILAAVGFGVWKLFLQPKPVPESVVQLSGRIEGDDSAIAPKVAGRIADIRFREGDSVKAGDVIATLDDIQTKTREDQAQAAVAEADSRTAFAQQQIAILEEQLRANDLQIEQSKTDAEGRVRQAEGDLAAAQAQLAQQEGQLKIAVFDRDAYTKLAADGAVTKRQGEQAQSNAIAQEAAVAAAKRKVEAAQGSLNVAKAALTNPGIREANSTAIRRQIAQQQSQIAAQRDDANRIRKQLQEAKENRGDLIIVAPFDGMIATRTAEPGEVVQPGTPIVTLIDMSKVYLRGYVPEGDIGKVKVGQAAHIYLDSNPSKPLDAFVSRVDPEATFTPENTYFREDRVKQVVGVKLQIKTGVGFAKPGMPADGEILVQGDTWPAENRK